jgi:competence protein ComEC
MLEVMIWDVDHGSAAYIKTPAGRHIAIDLGVGDMSAGQREFSPLRHLRWNCGVQQLDWLVITHPHRDHLDDIGNVGLVSPRMVCANRSISGAYIERGNQQGDRQVVGEYNALLQRYNQSVAASDSPTGGNGWGCNIQQFTPTYDSPNLNNYSLVTIFSYAESKIVIPGDNEAASWKSLLENPYFVQAIRGTDVFVASHHGRESGFYGELFDHFKPSLVVISDTNHGNTSVTNNYYQHASGWGVWSRRRGTQERRYCVTTRNDGYILIKCGTDASGNFREVTTKL